MAEAVEISWELESEVVGRSEAVPVRYVTGETIDSVTKDVESAITTLVGIDTRDWRDICARLDQCTPLGHTARAGLEIAAWDARRQTNGLQWVDTFGGGVRKLLTDVTIPMTSGYLECAREAVEKGATILKVKTGSQDWKSDIHRLQQIRTACPTVQMRIDANQGYDITVAIEFAQMCHDLRLPIQLIEQPTVAHDHAALKMVASRSPIPIFADESVLVPGDALKVLADTHVQGVNIKVMKSGIQGSLDIIAIARACRKQLMIGCMLETSFGISPSVALASSTGPFHFIDLDSPLLINDSAPSGCRYSGFYVEPVHDQPHKLHGKA